MINLHKYITLLLTTLIILFSCASSQNESMPPLSLKVCTVQNEEHSQQMTFACRTYSLYDMKITPRISGYLQTIDYAQGQPVKKGQLLYRIEQGEYDNSVASARAALASARSQKTNAENTYNRYVPLAEKRAISQSKLDAATAAYAEAIAAVNSAKAELKTAKENLGYTSYCAPFDGIIGATNGAIGEYVGIGTEYSVLNTLSNIDSIYVHLSIPTARYIEIAMRDTLRQKLYNDSRMLDNVELTLSNGTKYSELGVYKFTEREVNSSTGSVVLHVLFANPDMLLRPGEYVLVSAEVGAKRAMNLVEARCVMQQQGKSSVFVVDIDGTVEFRAVELGDTYGTLWEVRKGLSAGEMVLSEGLQKVHAGEKIKPIKI